MTIKTYRAGHLGTFSQSGIDKKSNEDEIPLKIVNYMDVYGNKKGVLRGEQFQEVTAPKGKFPFHLLRRGDVLITPSSETSEDIGHSAVMLEDLAQTAYSYHLVRFRPFKSTEIIPEFSRFAFQAQQVRAHLEKMSKGTTRKILTRNDFTTIPIIVPNLPTQRAIADFLDRETARIDTLIEKKQRLVELLGEKSQSSIESAINADGFETKLGHHVDILSGYAFPSADFSKDVDGVRLLRGANVSPKSVRWDDVVYWPHDRFHEVSRFALVAGDVVLGMDRPWISSGIRVAILTEIDTPSLLLQRVCRISPRKTLDKGFMTLLLRSKKFLGYFEPIMTGVSVPHISPDQVRSFRFSFVSVSEQKRRYEEAALVNAKIEICITQTEYSIDRLKEYRSALITSAVTGQIDVTKWTNAGTNDRQLDAIEEEFGA